MDNEPVRTLVELPGFQSYVRDQASTWGTLDSSPGVQQLATDANAACQNLSSEGLWLPPNEESSKGLVKRGPYAPGTVVQLRSASAGRCVQAVVVDSQDDCVRVVYYLGKRCCTKIVPVALSTMCQEKQSASQSRRLAVGSSVWVRSTSTSRWCKGFVTDFNSDYVRVHYWCNGTQLAKNLLRGSQDLCVPEEHSEELPGQAASRQLAVGSAVLVRDSRGGNDIHATVVAASNEQVRVQYMVGGRIVMKTVPVEMLAAVEGSDEAAGRQISAGVPSGDFSDHPSPLRPTCRSE